MKKRERDKEEIFKWAYYHCSQASLGFVAWWIYSIAKWGACEERNWYMGTLQGRVNSSLIRKKNTKSLSSIRSP